MAISSLLAITRMSALQRLRSEPVAIGFLSKDEPVSPATSDERANLREVPGQIQPVIDLTPAQIRVLAGGSRHRGRSLGRAGGDRSARRCGTAALVWHQAKARSKGGTADSFARSPASRRKRGRRQTGMDDEPQKISATDARQGVTGHNVRYVLLFGTGLAVLAGVILLYTVATPG